MKQHITRAYNFFEINELKGTIKKISKESRLKDEINFYRDISKSDLSIYFPRLINFEISEDINTLELEYYGYDNLGNLMVYEKVFDEQCWRKIIRQIFNSLDEFKKINNIGDYSELSHKMYIEKTFKYYNVLIEKFSKFKIISFHKTLMINGVIFDNFKQIWNKIKSLIEKELKNLNLVSVIHGDFCFSNILYDVNKKTDIVILKYIDPRGNFGMSGIFGDPLYDQAKLMHSFDGGYEYIIYDRFNLQENKKLNEFNLSFYNDNRFYLKQIFEEFPDFDGKKSKLIEGLIFIGMCSRHYDSLNRQTAMYLSGIKLLNQALTI